MLHTPEEINAELREADGMLATGTTIAQICQKPKIGEQTSHRRRNQYGGIKASKVKRLKELGQQNARAQSDRSWLVQGQSMALRGNRAGSASPRRQGHHRQVGVGNRARYSATEIRFALNQADRSDRMAA